MERFEASGLPLLPGRRVRARILSHQPWGVLSEIVGHEHVGASVDMIGQFGEVVGSAAELEALYPPVGAEIDAVVQEVTRWPRSAGPVAQDPRCGARRAVGDCATR